LDQSAACAGIMMVDDNTLAAGAMEGWVERAAGLRWLGWTGDAAAVVPMAVERRPAVVLLDVEMPGVDSFALLGALVAQCPFAAVVMFSGHTQPDLIGRALDEGAAGYIVKDEETHVIADLLARAARGECVLSPIALSVYMQAGTARP
jgi:two-component system, NarL family, response regulator DesR